MSEIFRDDGLLGTVANAIDVATALCVSGWLAMPYGGSSEFDGDFAVLVCIPGGDDPDVFLTLIFKSGFMSTESSTSEDEYLYEVVNALTSKGFLVVAFATDPFSIQDTAVVSTGGSDSTSGAHTMTVTEGWLS
jgi:hypothetical protein